MKVKFSISACCYPKVQIPRYHIFKCTTTLTSYSSREHSPFCRFSCLHVSGLVLTGIAIPEAFENMTGHFPTDVSAEDSGGPPYVPHMLQVLLACFSSPCSFRSEGGVTWFPQGASEMASSQEVLPQSKTKLHIHTDVCFFSPLAHITI